jgi:hypothetical protein
MNLERNGLVETELRSSVEGEVRVAREAELHSEDAALHAMGKATARAQVPGSAGAVPFMGGGVPLFDLAGSDPMVPHFAGVSGDPRLDGDRGWSNGWVGFHELFLMLVQWAARHSCRRAVSNARSGARSVRPSGPSSRPFGLANGAPRAISGKPCSRRPAGPTAPFAGSWIAWPARAS